MSVTKQTRIDSWPATPQPLATNPFFFKYRRAYPQTTFLFSSPLRVLFFSILVSLKTNTRLIKSQSLVSLINKAEYSAEVLVLKGRVLKPSIWFPFFLKMFLYLPSRKIALIFLGRMSLLKPFFSLFFRIKKVGTVRYIPNLTYTTLSLKKRRRIKKKIRKKIFS